LSLDSGRVLGEFRPGRSIYVQGAVGEPLALHGILLAAPEAMAGVKVTGCFLPGINSFDYAALHEGARLITFMLPPAMRPSYEVGRTGVAALAYSQIAERYSAGAPVDLAVLQVTPPDNQGLCSFGPCADFAPLVWPRARRRLAFVNAALPRSRRGPTIPYAAIEVAIHVDGPFITTEAEAPTVQQLDISNHIAALIPDGAAVQTGIGAAPAAALAGLLHHRRLRVRSGMVTPGYRALDEAGALARGAGHVTGLALGPADFVSWAVRAFTFADATITHGAHALALSSPLFAINSALEVDLLGQANIERRGERLVSGLGGAPDFARAARISPGGRGVLALPSTTRGGEVSRIVARLASPTVSIGREFADLVVTEHGVADLRGTCMDQRARALVAIADPAHRSRLEGEWSSLRRRL